MERLLFWAGTHSRMLLRDEMEEGSWQRGHGLINRPRARWHQDHGDKEAKLVPLNFASLQEKREDRSRDSAATANVLSVTVCCICALSLRSLVIGAEKMTPWLAVPIGASRKNKWFDRCCILGCGGVKGRKGALRYEVMSSELKQAAFARRLKIRWQNFSQQAQRFFKCNETEVPFK